MSSWLIWIIIGLILVFIEIFAHKFLFSSIGSSAIIVGIFDKFGIDKFYTQLIIFLIISAINIFVIRKLVSKYLIKAK
ncbi:MAG: hypothetical protein H8E33_02005 [Candidatus Cloacimonetes bacterium]|nr:hypothetical protein [Candidatus Cloacimonadota bacterium]MBL7108585.1 hypothetical protein [Candidatus Cloacimonadota bacterium]